MQAAQTQAKYALYGLSVAGIGRLTMREIDDMCAAAEAGRPEVTRCREAMLRLATKGCRYSNEDFDVLAWAYNEARTQSIRA